MYAAGEARHSEELRSDSQNRRGPNPRHHFLPSVDPTGSRHQPLLGPLKPALPTVGDVFMTRTIIFTNGDHAELRPCVVVRAPAHELDYITFIQRSTKPGNKPGIDHPENEMPGIDLPGRWVLDHERSVRSDTFLGSTSAFVGRLPDTYLLPLLEAWSNQ